MTSADAPAFDTHDDTVQFIAVDWSGNARSAARFTAVAAVRGNQLVSLETGRSGRALADHLWGLAAADPETVVGLDFAFSFPSWFLDERGYKNVDEVWTAACTEGEGWLTGPHPFWGRPGSTKPALTEHLRSTDRAVPAVTGISPKSVFQVGGAGAVGTGSIRGMPFLLDLVDRGFHVWPFETGWPLVIEIYPRILTGPVVKSSPSARMEYLQQSRWKLDPALLQLAASSDDCFDAAVSALVMAEHAGELAALSPSTDTVIQKEGQIWFPAGFAIP